MWQGMFARLKSFVGPDSLHPLLCEAEEAACRVFLEDSQIVSVITDCNTLYPWIIRT
jgi:hypothetical protein